MYERVDVTTKLKTQLLYLLPSKCDTDLLSSIKHTSKTIQKMVKEIEN